MSNNTIILSIIIPVYKVEDYLDNCVQSIIHQTFQDWELILVDDGSPDLSSQMCDAYAAQDDRIKVIHQENAGPGAARNAGLDIALGQYITFVDSDDWISNDAYNNIDFMEKNRSVDLVCFPICRDKRVIGTKKTAILLSGHKEIFYFWYQNVPIEFSVGNKIFRASFFNSNVRFPVGCYYEDWEFTLQHIIPNVNTIYISSIGKYYYRNNATSQMSSFTIKHWLNYFDVQNKMISFINCHSYCTRECIRYYVASVIELIKLKQTIDYKISKKEKRLLQNNCPSIFKLFYGEYTFSDLIYFSVIYFFGIRFFFLFYKVIHHQY